MLVILSSSLSKLWYKRQICINTDFVVSGCMLFVIPHIHKYAKYHSDSDHWKHIYNVIKTLFHVLPEDKMAVTQGIFWTEYTEFDNKNGSFYAD